MVALLTTFRDEMKIRRRILLEIVVLLSTGLLVGGPASVAVAAMSSRHADHHRHAHRHVAAASPVHRLGGAHGWNAYFYRDKLGRVCYLIGEPRTSKPAHMHRHRPMAMVTQRPKEHVTDVVSLVEGYPLKSGSDVSLDIDGQKFNMFTKGDTAWSRTAATDKAIVAAMIKGHRAVAKGTPEKGPATSDTYSLFGFTHALRLIDKACGIKR